MVGVYEWNRFKDLFPDLAAEYKTFQLDPDRPHAIKIELRNGIKLYFDCGKKPTEFTLTSDPDVLRHLTYCRRFKK